MTVSRELFRYRLDLVGVQEVRWEGSGTEAAGEYTFVCGKRNENREFGTLFLYLRESYQQLRELSLLVTLHSFEIDNINPRILCK
jgi:hypothetical protein